jgi:outer membrane protein assembly factor BamB
MPNTKRIMSQTTFRLPLLAAALLSAAVSHGQEWTRFRGPNGSGVSNADIPAKWTDANYAWKTKLPGVGHGSPVVWGDRVFLLCGDEASYSRTPVGLNTADGSIAWKREFAAAKHKHHKFNSVASTTPAVDRDRVVFSWGTTERLTLAAFDHSGKPLWESDLGPVKGGHGFGASPVIYKKLVVINNDQDGDSSLIAVDKQTGDIAWEIARDSERLTYSSPVVFNSPAGGEELIFTNWRHGITSVNPRTGKAVWEKSVFNQMKKERAIGSPIVAGDLIIGSCGFVQNPKHIVALRPDKSGQVAEVWRIERSVPHIPTPIVVGAYIFLWNDQGIVTCADKNTGKIFWNERVSSDTFGSPVCAKNKIFSIDKTGVVTVIAPTNKFVKLAENDLDEKCHTTPAISGGKMYVRTYENLIAIR